MSDIPIDPQDYITPQVIDLGEVRVARGMSRRPHGICPHLSLRYDSNERRVWCADCETTVEGFDAFMVMVNHFQSMDAIARRKLEEAEEARKAVVHRIAARNLEAIWRRKMAAACPHCRRGILPEDSLGGMAVEFEMAKRNKEGK